MISQDSVLVQLIRLVERIPSPPPPPRRRRGRPVFYSEKLFLKALVIMIVRRLHRVGELLAVLDEPTPEMRMVRDLLLEEGHFPSRRTFERRLKALPERLPEQVGCLGHHLVGVLKPWRSRGRAVALDSTVLRAKGGVWHKKDKKAGKVPHTSRYRGRLDQVGLAWVGLRVEAAPGHRCVRGLDPAGGSAHPRQHGG
jgi:hypothetical protein